MPGNPREIITIAERRFPVNGLATRSASNDAMLTMPAPGSAVSMLKPGGLGIRLSMVEQAGRIIVSSPYHPNFPARARGLGGEWDAVRRVWVFDAADQERVRSLCREIYRADGLENSINGTAPFPIGHNSNRNQFADGVTALPHYYGRRQRLRELMMTAGAESLPDYELLEVILFISSQRGDVKPLAKALLAQFGGFAEVMSATPDALTAAGLNLAGITAIKSVREAALG
jgi:hypothetical protein